MTFRQMVCAFDAIGYHCTGEQWQRIDGKRRRFYRFDFSGGNGTKKLTLAELREKLPKLTIYGGRPEYAPELSHIWAYGKKF